MTGLSKCTHPANRFARQAQKHRISQQPIGNRRPLTTPPPSRSMDDGMVPSPEKEHVANGANGAIIEASPGEIAHVSLSKLLRALSSGRRGVDLDQIRASCESMISSISAPPSPAGAAGAASAPPQLGIEVALPFLQALTTQNARIVEEALEGLHEILARGLIRWDVDFPTDPDHKVVLPPHHRAFRGISSTTSLYIVHETTLGDP